MALIEACASVEAVIERTRSLYADTHSGDAQVAADEAARLDQIAATTKAITDLAATAAPGGAFQRVVLAGLRIQIQRVQQVVRSSAQLPSRPADADRSHE